MEQEKIETLQDLKLRLREFAEVRDWDQFDVHGCTNAAGGRTPGAVHSPKNLSMALIAEAAKLGAFDVHGVFFSIPP